MSIKTFTKDSDQEEAGVSAREENQDKKNGFMQADGDRVCGGEYIFSRPGRQRISDNLYYPVSRSEHKHGRRTRHIVREQ